MAADRTLQIPRHSWASLVLELRRRGQNRRESGAFLLGKSSADGGQVKTFLCYDDLDPDALSGGYVSFHASGYSALWERCGQLGLQVLADVHTHPGKDVRQSYIDQEHPMLPVVGHIGLILPKYGNTSWWSMSGVGVHVYQGEFRWKSYTSASPENPVSLCVW